MSQGEGYKGRQGESVIGHWKRFLIGSIGEFSKTVADDNTKKQKKIIPLCYKL